MIGQARKSQGTRKLPKKYYRRREIRRLVVDLAALPGTVPGWMIRQRAREIGRDVATVERAIADVRKNPELPEETKGLPDDALEAIASSKGNVNAAHAAVKDKYGYSRSAFYRLWAEEDLAVRMAVKLGMHVLRNFLETRVLIVPHRNLVLYGDEVVIPVRCLDGKKLVEKLYVLAFLDAYSREVIVWDVYDSPATKEDTAALYAALLVGRVDGNGKVRGGKFATTIVDNGGNFVNPLFADLVGRFSQLQYARPYTPTDKAKEERAFETLQWTCLSDIPGIMLGPQEPPLKKRKKSKAADADPDAEPEYVETARKGWNAPLDALPAVKQLVAAINAAIVTYNHTVTSAHGMTPVDKYDSDPTIIETVDPLLVWDYMVRRGDHQIHRRGIHYRRPGTDNPWYRNSTDRPIDRTVSLRILPCIEDRVFVGTPGATSGVEQERYLATLQPNTSENGEQDRAISARNTAAAHRARTALKGAQQVARERKDELPSTELTPRASRPGGRGKGRQTDVLADVRVRDDEDGLGEPVEGAA